MVQPCATCKKHKRSEWERLKNERVKLRKSIEEAHEAQEKARDALNLAFAKEMRLRQQLDLLEKREAEAIAVEEASIEDQESVERAEILEEFSFGPDIPGGPILSPSTWNALDGGFDLGSEFWEMPKSYPDVGGTGVIASASS
ncbi:hypothetical protein B0A55_13594 [Friedmanniomyces simplex]|uniref:Uncharacterized protein n=1 Tax=Friedmanniomyces simplex TaxID=329884 RepID=A0A4U0VLQ7_9PEZI|nr:hypothetical protein B0A55_13594 [Friedmanniomyces simplex]